MKLYSYNIGPKGWELAHQVDRYDSDGPNSDGLKYYSFSLAFLTLSAKPLGFLLVAAPIGLLNLGSSFGLFLV